MTKTASPKEIMSYRRIRWPALVLSVGVTANAFLSPTSFRPAPGALFKLAVLNDPLIADPMDSSDLTGTGDDTPILDFIGDGSTMAIEPIFAAATLAYPDLDDDDDESAVVTDDRSPEDSEAEFGTPIPLPMDTGVAAAVSSFAPQQREAAAFETNTRDFVRSRTDLLEELHDLRELADAEDSGACAAIVADEPRWLVADPKASAATVVPSYVAPTILQIVKFALPATAIYLCDPFLSLIDTASVGLLAGTNHQAALSPAVAVVRYSALLLSFLFVGTTNFVASAGSAAETQQQPEDESHAKTVLSSLQISCHTGIMLGTALFAVAPQLIRALGGRTTPLDAAVFEPAVAYVRIRSLGFPAAAVLGSAQAACLGLKDTKTPLLVLASAAILNVIGDLCFVGCKASPILYGAAGAAWATVLGQYGAVTLFLRLLKAKAKPTKARNSEGGSLSAKGLLANHDFKLRHVANCPPKSTVRRFLPYVAPVLTTSVGRVSLFISMAHVVSSCMGVVGMAAQSIVLGIFEAICPLSDSLSLTAQSFVPAALKQQGDDGYGGNAALSKITSQFLKAGAIFSVINLALVAAIPLISNFFTSNAIVVAKVNSLTPYLAGIFATHGLVMASEGLLLSRGEQTRAFLGWMYGAFFFAMPAWMMRVKRQAFHLGKDASLESIWVIFLSYQVLRTALWVGRASFGAFRPKRKGILRRFQA